MTKIVAPKPYFRDFLDINQCPDGGDATGVGLNITWQRGPLVQPDGSVLPPNGAFVETVIQCAKHRLEFYQSTRFKCAENEEAIKHLESALESLAARFKRRDEAGTLGTHKPD